MALPIDRLRTALRFATGEWRKEVLRQIAELEPAPFPVQTGKVQRQDANSPEEPHSGPLSVVAPAAANPTPTPHEAPEPAAPATPAPPEATGEPEGTADPNWWHHGDRLEELRRRFAAGQSYSIIGPAMGTTKNAAISAAHRYDIGMRRAPAPLRKPAPTASFADLKPGSCVWPNGHPGKPGFHFCGAEVLPGLPYCSSHAAVAFVRPRANNWTEERREEAAAAARRRKASNG